MEKIPVPPCSGDDAVVILNYSLRQLLRFIRHDGSEAVLPPCEEVHGSIIKGSTITDGRWGIVYSVFRPGLVGIYFYCQGNNFMTEMVDPEDEHVTEILEIE